ncbi:MAG: cytochrome d ubiquinol oxidase subunit II [Ottowia sp.]|nr:cytochrome d ubiquinol oxidase subunit II [Ottowia sp.]
MMPNLMDASGWLPLVFWGLLGVAMFAYVVLDGYDLGVGMLMARAPESHQDVMIASIGPFWDANETWLVLGVGLLLVAFPVAHGVVLSTLYIPVALMLAGLILRGVSFDFRAKVRTQHKPLWNTLFCVGSLVTTMSQGVMLGRYITGFAPTTAAWFFAWFVGLCLVAGYGLLGAAWLIMKTEGDLQMHALRWARICLWFTGLGVAAVSLATPYVSSEIFNKWFAFPNIILLAPIPLLTVFLFILSDVMLRRLGRYPHRFVWVPFVAAVGIFALSFNGIAYSLFPYIVVNHLTLWQAAAAPESLMIILWGVVVVLPAIIAYTAFSYWVFWGKAQQLSYH